MKVNGQSPAERNMERHYMAIPFAVHSMILALHRRGLIDRTPGRARSIRILLPRAGRGRPLATRVRRVCL